MAPDRDRLRALAADPDRIYTAEESQSIDRAIDRLVAGLTPPEDDPS